MASFEGAFADLSELKTRLSISDTVDDADLLRTLKDASGAMEAYVGRRLLREHAIVETFDGGRDVIRVSTPPIAKVHWIRESDDRDFDTAANYDELVEGTDYHLLGEGAAGRPGAGGGIKRIDQNWMGSRSASGKVRVAYTGGYKSDQEAAIENTHATISGENADNPDTGIRTLPVRKNSSTQVKEVGPTVFGLYTLPLAGLDGEDSVQYACYSIRTRSIILPGWSIAGGIFTFKAQKDWGYSDYVLRGRLLDVDPIASSAPVLFDAIATAANWGSSWTVTSEGTMANISFEFTSDAEVALLNAALLNGHISFGFAMTSPTGQKGGMPGNGADTTVRPACLLFHVTTYDDFWPVPYDLRSACLTQAVNNWQNRKHPGLVTGSQRGVSIASGAAFQKRPMELLPYVEMVCDRYRRV